MDGPKRDISDTLSMMVTDKGIEFRREGYFRIDESTTLTLTATEALRLCAHLIRDIADIKTHLDRQKVLNVISEKIYYFDRNSDMKRIQVNPT